MLLANLRRPRVLVVLVDLLLVADVLDVVEDDPEHLAVPHLPLVVVEQGPRVIALDVDLVFVDGLEQLRQIVVVEHDPRGVVVALGPPVRGVAAAVLRDVDRQLGLVGVVDPVEQLPHAPPGHVEPARLGRGDALVHERVGDRDLVVEHLRLRAIRGVAVRVDDDGAVVVEAYGLERGPPLLQQLPLGGRELREVRLPRLRRLHALGVVVDEGPLAVRDAVDGVHEPPKPIFNQLVRLLDIFWIFLIDRVLVVAVVDDGELEVRVFLQDGLGGERVRDDHVVRRHVWPDIDVHERRHRGRLPPAARQLRRDPGLVEGGPVLDLGEGLEAKVGVVSELLHGDGVDAARHHLAALRLGRAVPALVKSGCLLVACQHLQVLDGGRSVQQSLRQVPME
mmetsp:Transcript_2546/g.7157  ORF Transcript_2546/g.7157 Transcript_2546/m.7157 type:complete len:394 (-) Transcript_2546:503-1684(-)